MAGIAIAESGGDTMALNVNPQTEDYSVGLWQINYFGNLAPSRTARFGTPDQLSTSPARQARAAISLFGKNGAGLSSAWGGGGNLTNADPVYRQWAAAGYPNHPSTAQVTQWLHEINRGTGFYQAPGTYSNGVFSGPNSNVKINGTSTAAVTARQGQTGAFGPQGVTGTAGAAGASSAAGGTGCSGSDYAINILGLHVLDGCQRKAIVSGLIVAGGSIIFVGGLIVLAASLGSTPAAKAATRAAKVLPVGRVVSGAGKAAKVAGRASKGTAKAAKAAPAPKSQKRAPLSDEETARVIKAGEAGAFKKKAA
jgi:uncharacterized membrane protein YgdD (TMEM256/DUF423 family)